MALTDRYKICILITVLFCFTSSSYVFSYFIDGDSFSYLPLEKRILKVLNENNLSNRILNIESLSFRNTIIVGIWFYYGLSYVENQNDVYQDLMTYAKKLTELIFTSFPSVSELNLSGIFKYNHITEWRYDNPTFTASINRKHFDFFYSEDTPFDLFLDRVGRVYYSEALLSDDLSSLRAESYIEENTNRVSPPRKSGLFAKLRGFDFILRKTNKNGIYKNIIWRGNPKLKEIAITFDDGPKPIYTPLILEILKRYSVKATFFVVGKKALLYHYFIKDIIDNGHTVGNHTMHHLNLNLLPYSKKEGEILDAQSIISTLSGKRCKYFRPPGGSYDWKVEKVTRDNSLLIVLWTKETGDYFIPQEESKLLLLKAMASLVPGAIIIFHIGVKSTIEVLPEFLSYVKKKGYKIVPLEKLIENIKKSQGPEKTSRPYP
ncbi:MAG: polysaccharide deacetylase family protein [bacterium]|nr:polysaccharide deacetylase family protein [bacterium]